MYFYVLLINLKCHIVSVLNIYIHMLKPVFLIDKNFVIFNENFNLDSLSMTIQLIYVINIYVTLAYRST